MRNIEVSHHLVAFPQKEYATAFMAENDSPFQNASIGITYPYPDYHISRHPPSPVNVFEYVLEGEGEILLDGTWQTAQAGDIYILRAGKPQQYRANPQNPWKKIWINYVADYISPMLDAYRITDGIYRAENACSYFEQLLEYATNANSFQDSAFDIADCLHKIIHTVATERLPDKGDAYRLRTMLSAAVYDKVTLDDIAAKLHLSKSNVIRLFKKEYGVTPYEYLLTLKISAAKLLLKDTKMTVREIAERLHIADEHYFSSLFLSRVGMRPRDYRSGKR